jgi:hypothetical protein
LLKNVKESIKNLKTTKPVNEEFFKIRNSSSAFDKIGHMGEIKSKLVGGDINEYRTFLENKRSQTKEIFEHKKIEKL